MKARVSLLLLILLLSVVDQNMVVSESTGNFLTLFVQPPSPNTPINPNNNCTMSSPCPTIIKALDFAVEERAKHVLINFLRGSDDSEKMKCGPTFFTSFETIILQSYSDLVEIDCLGLPLIHVTKVGLLRFSRLTILNSSMDVFGLRAFIDVIEFENCVFRNLKFVPNKSAMSLNVTGTVIENSTLSAGFSKLWFENSTLGNVSVFFKGSFGEFTYMSRCTLEGLDYRMASLLDTKFTLVDSSVKNSHFSMRRTKDIEISGNQFQGDNRILQSYCLLSYFNRNVQIGGTVYISIKYLGTLSVEDCFFQNISFQDYPIFEIGNTYSVEFKNTNFFNIGAVAVEISQVLEILFTTCNFDGTVAGIIADSDDTNELHSRVDINLCKFTNNGNLNRIGGAVRVRTYHFSMIQSSFSFNKAKYGGAIYVESSVISTGFTATNNVAEKGGAIYYKLKGKKVYIRATLSENRASLGAGMFLASDNVENPILSLDYLKCDSNVAEFSGGCIYSVKSFEITEDPTVFISNNSAASYGNDIGYELDDMSFILQVSFGNNSVTTLNISNDKELTFSQYPGEKLTLTIRDINFKKEPVKFLQKQVGISVNSEGLIYGKEYRSNEQFSFSLVIINENIKQVNGVISIDNFQQNITINILACPDNSFLTNPLSNGFICYSSEEYQTFLMIVIPISVIIGALLITLIVLMSIVIWKGIRYVHNKLSTLKRKERAEKLLESKVIDKQVIFGDEFKEPLLSDSYKELHEQSFVIPIENITIEKKIGEGSNGIIYLANWMGKHVALKTLKIDGFSVEDGINEEFEKEAALLNSLSHPSIVKIYGISLSTYQKYMVVEYVRIGSLDRLIYNSKKELEYLSLLKKIKILTGVAEGMNYLHSLKPPIIHRDLKPGNILIDDDFKGKVSDFGLSINKYSASTKNIGTLFYLPNEMMEDNGHYTTKVDVYSFAIILWEIFFEEHCYFNSRSHKIHRFHTNYDDNSINEYNIIVHVLNGLRPKIPFQNTEEMHIWLKDYLRPKENYSMEKLSTFTHEYIQLTTECWDKNPDIRPSFKDILHRLNKLHSILR